MFYDTNIIYYAYDLYGPERRKVCKRLVENVFSGKAKCILSNQILVELFNALTRKLGIDLDSAGKIVNLFISSQNWTKINYDHKTVKSALITSRAFKSPFLDTLIAETMRENGISQIVTENESAFKRIPRINVNNPILK